MTQCNRLFLLLLLPAKNQGDKTQSLTNGFRVGSSTHHISLISLTQRTHNPADIAIVFPCLTTLLIPAVINLQNFSKSLNN